MAIAQSSATYAGDDLRTGWYSNQPLFTPQAVAGPGFGKIFDAQVIGQIYAQPLVSNNVLLIATEDNWIYGLDPIGGALKWSRNVGQPWFIRDISCPDLSPNIGITGTPVIDAAGIAYFFKKTYTSGTSGAAEYWMHAVDVSTGAERSGFPVKIAGAAQNDPTSVFDAKTLLNRTGLLLMNGVVYAGFGGMCDRQPYKGWVVGVTTAGRITAMWTVMQGTASGGGVWQSGGGLVSDGAGRIFFATGNGIGGSPNAVYTSSDIPPIVSQSVVRLAVQPDGSLKPDNFFAAYDAVSLDGWDADLGSGAPVALPTDRFGTATVPKLLVLAGKEGYVYLLNRDNLGGQKMGQGGGDQVVARIGPYGGVWSRPAVWPGDGGYIYMPTASAGTTAGPSGLGYLRVYKYGLDGLGAPSLSLAASAAETFGFGTSSPIVTSSGTTSGSALVWLIKSPDGTGMGAQLVAYDAVPVNGTLTQRFTASVGTAAKFTPPGIGPARVYVGTRDGHVIGFGIPVVTPLTAPATDFGTVTVGQSKTLSVTLTAQRTVSLTSVTGTSAQFTIGATALPKTLTQAQTVSVPVTFQPTVSGLATGSVHVLTDQGTVDFSLSGTGQRATAEIQVYPLVASLGGTAVGGQLNGTLRFTNAGGTPLTVTGAILPTSPFTATGYPPPNFVMNPGQSVDVSIQFHPLTVGSYSSQFTLTTTAGNATAQLTGSATTPAVLVVTPLTLNFGTVAVGNSVSLTFKVQNAGGTTLTITKSKPPILGQFFSTTSLDEGSTLAPGASRIIGVRFSPTVTGALTDTWTINSDAPTGLETVTFQGTGSPPTGALSGTQTTPQGVQNLTALGTLDWVHWGLNATGPGDRKTGGVGQISDYRVINGSSAYRYTNNPTAFSWNDGLPQAAVSSTTTGVYANGIANGFEITAAAGTLQRTLRVYVGVYNGAGTLTASLSDNSAPEYIDASFQSSVVLSSRVYAITYRAASDNQKLTVRFTLTAASGYGNVTLEAATMEASAGGAMTGSLSATPASVTLSAAGMADWIHWGLGGPLAVNRMAGVSPQISNFTALGSTAIGYSNNRTAYSWTGGTPVTTATNTTTGVYVWGKDNGFRVSVPADQTTRTLNVYVGVYRATGKLTAALSDASAASYINAALSNATATSNGIFTLVYRASKPGQTLTVAFTRVSTDDTGNVTLQAAALSTLPALVATMTPTPASVTLSSAGATDWVHWGFGGPNSVNRMAGVNPQISTFTTLGSQAIGYSNNTVGYSWTGGTPVAAATNTTTGVYVWGKDSGFRFSVPADQTTRTLSVYIGVYRATGKLAATLSDGSAASYSDTSLSNPTTTSNGLCTLTYRAATPGQTLTVTFTRISTDDTGNVTLQAAVLSTSPAPIVGALTPTLAPFTLNSAAAAASAKDMYGNSVTGSPVKFTAPASGPSGDFAGSTNTVTATTNSSGAAVASAFTANVQPGGKR